MQTNRVAAIADFGRTSSAKATSDEVLLQLVADGDKDAMRVLFARHNVRVFRFLTRIVGNEATAEDLLNEVFLEVWRNAGRFEARSQVSTWILAIARFKALAAMRRRRHDELDDEASEMIEDTADDPEVAVQKTERSALLQQCLKQLSIAHRQVVDLVYYHEQSIEEVAEIIGVPASTVKTRVFYARKRIAELMAERGLERASL
ncbi:MAG: sigma-70 family RNA polymerase sigma factor [Xanthobacteraceae bacterium]|jgi:RNA polymerase sigma-70 factor (ECF subfamily)